MKRIFVFVVVLLISIPALCCADYQFNCRYVQFYSHRQPIFTTHQIGNRALSQHTWNNSFIMVEPVQMHRLHYSGIPFNNTAVFCRMENQCLRTFHVKFSIHAGVYSE